jgi:deoxyribonuclease V
MGDPMSDGPMWPSDAAELLESQQRLAGLAPEPWRPGAGALRAGGCWVCFPRGEFGPGEPGDLAWSAAALLQAGRTVARRVVRGAARAGYLPGMLAMRVGPLLEEVVRQLPHRPDVLLVDGTGRDHPRRAGLALHLGAELGVPTVGVTHRPLLAAGAWPDDRRDATAPLTIDGTVVAAWVRTRAGTRPLVVHPGWRTDLDSAVKVVLGLTVSRTPEPLRVARQAAREARAADTVMRRC